MSRFLILIVSVVVLCYCQHCIAQQAFPALRPDDIPDGSFSRSEYFDGSALYGLIDGGADLYLEYGFSKALVQELRWNGYAFRIEIYQMNTAGAAFGIFSISRRTQARPDSFAAYCSQSPYQIRIAKGAFYISIASDSGTVVEQSLARKLAQTILTKISTTEFHPPKFFTNIVLEPYLSGLKFVRGKLGIQNGFPLWEDLFEGIAFTSMYILPISIGDTTVTVALIEFPGNKDKVAFQKKSGVPPGSANGFSNIVNAHSVKAIRGITPATIIYLESDMNGKRLTPFLDYIREFK